jgi:hypothetical protein
MNQLQMKIIKPKIVDVLEARGYKFIQQQSYEKWTRGRNKNVWFSKQIVRATINTEGTQIVKSIAGIPNGSVSEAQQQTQDSWYTDGYRSRGTAAI